MYRKFTCKKFACMQTVGGGVVRGCHASLARFTLTRSQFGAFHFGAMPVWRVSLWRVSHVCAYADPVSAKASFKRAIFRISVEMRCFLRPFGAY